MTTKWYSTRSSSSEESKFRQECAATAFAQNSNTGIKTTEVQLSAPVKGVQAGTTIKSFGLQSGQGSSNRSSQCSANQRDSNSGQSSGSMVDKIISKGSLPSSDFEEWIKSVQDNPVVIGAKLVLITELLHEDMLDDIKKEEPDLDIE